MDRVKVSLIVTSHNRLNYSEIMYNSLLKYTKHPHELVWVDCISTDGTREWLNSEMHKNTKKVFIPKMGVGEAMNVAFGECDKESKYIGDLDNDIILTDGWLTRLLEHMENDDKIGACHARWELRGYRGTPDKIHSYAQKLKNEKGVTINWWVNGSHTLYRRSALEDVGLWNPTFWGGEDKDIGIRLTNAGWKCTVARNTCVFHFQGRTTKRIDQMDSDWRKRREESEVLLNKLYTRDMKAKWRNTVKRT